MTKTKKQTKREREEEWQEREENYKRTIRRMTKRLNKASVQLPSGHMCDHCLLSIPVDDKKSEPCIACFRKSPCETFCKGKGAYDRYCSKACHDDYVSRTSCK
jgi:hypothetical protein